MAANFMFGEANGASQVWTGSRTEANWKNIDDSTTAYSSAPITAGNNSFEKWQAGTFSGSFNQIQNGTWAHTAGYIGLQNFTLKAFPKMTKDADRLAYATPAVAANANLSFDATGTISIASGNQVFFGPGGVDAAGKNQSCAVNPCYTNFLTTQFQTAVGAVAGDTPVCTLTLQYQEN